MNKHVSVGLPLEAVDPAKGGDPASLRRCRLPGEDGGDCLGRWAHCRDFAAGAAAGWM